MPKHTILILLILLIHQSLSNTIYISNTGSTTYPCGSPEQPCRTLALGIAQCMRNCTLNISSGQYHSEGNIGLVIPQSISDIRFMSSHGNERVRIYATSDDRIVKQIGARRVRFDGIEFFNGRTGFDGGCIYVGDRVQYLAMVNCAFSRCVAMYFGGAVSVSSLDAVVEMTNVSFVENKASNGGGLYVRNSGIVSLSDVLFEGNVASLSGGGVHGLSPFVIKDTEFLNNWAGSRGGALYLSSTNGIVTKSEFSNNTAKEGGGFYGWNIRDETTFSECNFKHNHADDIGSAVCLKEANVILSNSTFSNNEIGNRNVEEETVYCDSTTRTVYGRCRYCTDNIVPFFHI
eukprot:TRINITY_DN3547_c0_g1_i1.p1 TRINITY_DN3547_c0_g1~~TRINITY_DN3547_c0_g1_i1.p1  ORF type:complete len:354 (-),score=60.47 TRINITY_DN3547_c0_g1_i1:642-1679(-)